MKFKMTTDHTICKKKFKKPLNYSLVRSPMESTYKHMYTKFVFLLYKCVIWSWMQGMELRNKIILWNLLCTYLKKKNWTIPLLTLQSDLITVFCWYHRMQITNTTSYSLGLSFLKTYASINTLVMWYAPLAQMIHRLTIVINNFGTANIVWEIDDIITILLSCFLWQHQKKSFFPKENSKIMTGGRCCY